MLGSVYGRIAAQEQAERDAVELSARVMLAERPDMDETDAREEAAALWHPLIGHPLVAALAEDVDATGPGAALAYLDEPESDETDVRAVIAWMSAGAYKGHFGDAAEFCRDQFCEALENQVGAWGSDVGFPDEPVGELIDWEKVAEHAEDGDTWYFLESDSGVYVFDASIDLHQYRDGR